MYVLAKENENKSIMFVMDNTGYSYLLKKAKTFDSLDEAYMYSSRGEIPLTLEEAKIREGKDNVLF